MQLAFSKSESPIRIVSPRPDFERHTSIRVSAVWIALLAILFLAGCGISYNTLPLSVSPSAISFGSVTLGKAQTTTVTLANSGMKAVTLSAVQSADAAFTVDASQSQTTIPGGGTAIVQVTFKPVEAKSYSSQLLVQSGDGQTTIPVSGVGQQTPKTTPAPPATSPALQVSATSLQFGSVPIGGNGQQNLTLTSSGNAPLQISTLATTGAGFSAQTPSLPLTLQPGQVLNLPVKFVPAASGAAAGNLNITSNAVDTPSVTVNLAGNGTSSAPVPPTQGTPALTLSSNAIDFGSVAVGSKGSGSVTLTSSGTASVVVQSMDVSGADFSAVRVQLPLTLAPGQQVTLPLSFAPTSAGSEHGNITLTDNATGSPNVISLTGKGTAVPPVQNTPALTLSSTAVDFGSVAMGSKGTDSFRLSCNGLERN